MMVALVELDAGDALVRGLDFVLELVDLRDERHQRRLQRAHGVELVLRVHHLLGEAVARRLAASRARRGARAGLRASDRRRR